MTEPSRVRNLAVLLVLVSVFTIPAIFIEHDRMLDIVSGLMLLFGAIGFYFIAGEAWRAFWAGDRDRTAVGLYGLSTIFISVVAMRAYGILTRNYLPADAFLTPTHTYAFLVFMQFIGLLLFTNASSEPQTTKRISPWGQMLLGVGIGILLASSRLLEPLLSFLGKILAMTFSKM